MPRISRPDWIPSGGSGLDGDHRLGDRPQVWMLSGYPGGQILSLAFAIPHEQALP